MGGDLEILDVYPELSPGTAPADPLEATGSEGQ
jgi:hypothetical protein